VVRHILPSVYQHIVRTIGAALAIMTLAPAPFLTAGESHLTNVRQLTFGGDNAEAYFNGCRFKATMLRGVWSAIRSSR
jgi:hypothetical protein